MNPCIAIINRDTLSSLALQNILWEIFPTIEVKTYHSITEFISDSNYFFVHFFVSDEILLKNINEFETLKNETFVISTGPADTLCRAGYKVIDASLPERELIATILQLHKQGHHNHNQNHTVTIKTNILSQREEDVLCLAVKGFINKEIADKLNISIATVIFHRNNIYKKLNTRSIGKLTIYAVFSGLININEL